MDSSTSLGLLSLVILIILNGTLASAHSALVNARRGVLKDRADAGNKRAKLALSLAENSSQLLASRQLVSTILHFCVAGLATMLLGLPLMAKATPDLFPQLNIDIRVLRFGILLLTWMLAALVMMLFGELLPDVLASAYPERLAITSAGVMHLLMRVTIPMSAFPQAIAKLISKPFGKGNLYYVTEEEIKTLVDAGSEEGVIEDDEKEMIYSIFQFGDKVVRELMVPRIDISALEAWIPISKAIDTVLSGGYSRIPVYEDSIDHIVGLLYAKDALRFLRNGQNQNNPIRNIMRPAYFVPESKRASALLEELQARRIHMAIVIDEYGGTAGLITIEDLLEEIVGNIQDEYDPDEEAEYIMINDNEYVFDAGILLADVNEILKVELPTSESDTLGGFVLSTLNKVPLTGETFNHDSLKITVEMITGRRIRKVRVAREIPVLEDVEPTVEPVPVEAAKSASASQTLPAIDDVPEAESTPTTAASELNGTVPTTLSTKDTQESQAIILPVVDSTTSPSSPTTVDPLDNMDNKAPAT